MTGRRKPTSTSAFGVGRRESHDASGFYERFTAPVLSGDENVVRSPIGEKPILGDARQMDEVEDGSVALVVTSPPYFAGKEYEEALGEGHVPASYFEYLAMLEAVFAEAVRTLEAGGRIAVNVANLGRKPYRSLSADVIGILQDRLGLLLRGEVIWLKARGASGSCAWGSFQSPANPVLRDVTERVVIASKGRFDRALTRPRRAAAGLPSEISVSKDEFIEATTDVWEIGAERATRVGHPAPFPVELPQRLIELYTYRDDLVLDPFMGSGTTGVAAVRTGRRFVGYDTESAYVEIAEERIRAEKDLRMADAAPADAPRQGGRRRTAAAPRAEMADGGEVVARAKSEGRKARELAKDLLEHCGFAEVTADVRVGNGVEVSFSAVDGSGQTWYFDVSGAFTSTRAGLRRADALWKALGKAAVVQATGHGAPFVLMTTDAPTAGSTGDQALKALTGSGRSKNGSAVFDVIELESSECRDRLRAYAAKGRRDRR
ncbi:MAG TPA: site-specific DNA-methyltransferase [Acidimicrobiales bacterium]|nr:site-specific DNA-methyltransferase [Acidimicrobiales bacterium]